MDITRIARQFLGPTCRVAGDIIAAVAWEGDEDEAVLLSQHEREEELAEVDRGLRCPDCMSDRGECLCGYFWE